jgi:hypothetical protein
MSNEAIKTKVIALLIKWGNNEQEVIEMVNKNFESVSSYCSTSKSIAECIRTVS